MKRKTRELMSDEEAAQQLDEDYPVEDFDYYKEKYKAEGLSDTKLWEKIIGKSKKTNENVNSKYGSGKQ